MTTFDVARRFDGRTVVDNLNQGDVDTTFVDVEVTSAQLLALNATPVTIVAAPGAGFALQFLYALLHKPAGTAYGGVATGEDLAIKYTNAAGATLGSCETTGFLDQATSQFRLTENYQFTTGVSDRTPLENAPLVLHLLLGEITTGDSPLRVRTFFRRMPVVLF